MSKTNHANTTIDWLTGAEYRKLLEAEANLALLHSRAVDHWDGYAVLPDIDDFGTIIEWQVACAEFEANEL